MIGFYQTASRVLGGSARRVRHAVGFIALAATTLLVPSIAQAVTLTVVGPDGTPVPVGYRWLVEEDRTYDVIPGVTCTPADPVENCPGVNFHRSYMPVVSDGLSTGGAATISGLDPLKRYFISILPDEGFANGGAPVAIGQTEVKVLVQPMPLPTAQIRVLVFQDNFPTNGAWDTPEEVGLADFDVLLFEAGGTYGQSGGQVTQDCFGSPLGTTYNSTCSHDQSVCSTDAECGTGNTCALDANSVQTLGNGHFKTSSGDEDAIGYVVIKNLCPAKYTIQTVPPPGQGWVQTTTIEGTHGDDAWVKANEPSYFQEFGPPGPHVAMGFVKQFNDLVGPGGVSIRGQVRNLHNSRPPDFTQFSGDPVPGCWVGLNPAAEGSPSLLAQPCNTDSTFEISSVPPGDYNLAIWDANLDRIFSLNLVTVGAADVDLIDVPVFDWFAHYQGVIFNDVNRNSFRDPGEIGIQDAGLLLRFRDGSIYQATSTDAGGRYEFKEVFPFFNWLVAEVDFATKQATGATVVVDGGGPVNSDQGWDYPSFDKLNPQRHCDSFLADGTCVGAQDNPNTGNNLSRTEAGPVLLEGIQNFMGQTHVIEWGKANYLPGHNGGITGIVHYAVTIAENNPQFAAAENWEPGVPRVQVNLYKDANRDGVIDMIVSPSSRCSNDPGGPVCTAHADCEPVDAPPLGDGPNWGKCGGVRADVDNPPWEWRVCSDDSTATCVSDTECVAGTCGNGTVGAEDIDWNGNGTFDPGDAISIVTTDSWDDALPEGCQGDAPFTYDDGSPGGVPRDCFDGLRAFGQVRPALWDGGYAFWSVFPGGIASGSDAVEDPDGTTIPAGTYIVEGTTPPGYELLKEEHKNVDFGPEATPSPLLIPPACYGDQHLLPQYLTRFSGQANQVENPSNLPYDDTKRAPLCDMKQVTVRQGQNAAADLFLMTHVPVAGHISGFILNDFANEFDPNAPTFGEKYSPPYLPIAIRDWSGREISRVYSDRWGNYSALVPSTYWTSAPDPSGVSPNMLTACMNSPGPIPNPAYDPDLSVCSANTTLSCTTDADCGANQTCVPNAPQLITDPHFDRRYSQFCYTFQYMPGKTTYLDTPVQPIAAYAGPAQFPTDCEFQDGTPVIWSVYGSQGGPYLPSGSVADRTITIVSAGTQVAVPNPAYDEVAAPKTITRNFGFGATPGTVTIGTTVLSIISWNADVITALVPTSFGQGSVGQLAVTRSVADGGKRTEVGVTVYRQGTGASAFGVHHVAPSATGWPDRPIQAAIDAAAPGALILVAPGTYNENVIMWKPVRLQGWGAASTLINAAKFPAERLQWWRDTVNGLITAGSVDLLPAQEAGFALPEPDTLFTEEGPGVVVLAQNTGPNNFPSTRNARIDGFAITGADHGGAIFVNGYADFLQISNNRVFANQGVYGGGIRVGHPLLVDQTQLNDQGETVLVYQDCQNDSVVIHHNQVIHNGSADGTGGGISINHGSDLYRVEDNFVCGNFTSGNGAGIGQYGYSNNGRIANNKILFNESFNQGAASAGGGISIAGAPPLFGSVLTPGSGHVSILNNLIQGNTAGSGDGGGIRLAFVNGQEIADSPHDLVLPVLQQLLRFPWYHAQIYNNIIIDNIAAQAGGGISLQDAARVSIVHNTIINNDSTGTAGVLFGGGNVSTPQVAGIVARAHSVPLATELATYVSNANVNPHKVFSNPLLYNDIIRNNRSFYFTIDPNAVPAPIFGLSPNIGGGDPAVIWDLSVEGVAGQFMNPRECVLSSNWEDDDSDPWTPFVNVVPGPYLAANGNFTANPLFTSEYVNTSPGQTIQQPEQTTSIAVAPAFDEGGNFITVRFGPLTPNVPPAGALYGDEHIGCGSPAANAGGSFATTNNNPFSPGLNLNCGSAIPANRSPLCLDYDGSARPTGSSTQIDIGADERTISCFADVGTASPTAIMPADLDQPAPETAIAPAPAAPAPKALAPAPSLSRRPGQSRSSASGWVVINPAPVPAFEMRPVESEKKKSAETTAKPEVQPTGTKPAVEGEDR